MRFQYHSGDEPIPGYQLIKLLGRGGFGEVWSASTPGGAEAAIKFIDLAARDSYKEVRALNLVKRIRHANVVPLFGLWTRDSEGRVRKATDTSGDFSAEVPYAQTGPVSIDVELMVVMGLGDKSLYDRLVECRQEGLDGIPREELLNYMSDAARAIDFLNTARHEVGSGAAAIHHGDIKPHNIMVVGGSAQLCDLGLARLLDDARVTRLAISAVYAAPECLQGRPPTATSDQYSLAVSYVELCAGELPFVDVSNLKDIVYAHLNGQLDLSGLSPAERKVIRTATAVDPEQRFASATELVEALRRAGRIADADDTVIEKRKIRSTTHRGSRHVESRRRPSARKPALMQMGVAAIAVAAAVLAVWMETRGRTPAEADRKVAAVKSASQAKSTTAWPAARSTAKSRAAEMAGSESSQRTPAQPIARPKPTPKRQNSHAVAATSSTAAAPQTTASPPTTVESHSTANDLHTEHDALAGVDSTWLLAHLDGLELAPGRVVRVMEASRAELFVAARQFAAWRSNTSDRLVPVYYRRQAEQLADQSRFDEAVVALSRAIALEPRRAENYVARAVVHRQSGQIEQALADLRQALGLEPDLASAYGERGTTMIAQRQYPRAIADLNLAIGLDPSATHYEQRGLAHAFLGNMTPAIEDYTRAIELRATASAYRLRAVAQLKQQQLDLALADLNAAIGLDPQDAMSLRVRALVNLKLRRYAAAVADRDAAGKLNPRLAPMLAAKVATPAATLECSDGSRHTLWQGQSLRLEADKEVGWLVSALVKGTWQRGRVTTAAVEGR